MKLTIKGTSSLKEVQQDFNAIYPYLKIEFFRPQTRNGMAGSAMNMLNHGLKINDARRQRSEGSLELRDEMKVADLEKAFKDEFGLNVQVFRKSGNIWLETTMTDQWTLKQQNEHGCEISTSF